MVFFGINRGVPIPEVGFEVLWHGYRFIFKIATFFDKLSANTVCEDNNQIVGLLPAAEKS